MTRRNLTEAQIDLITQAKAEVVEWDEFGQGFSDSAELVMCICGQPYPLRDDIEGFARPHYCPADEGMEDDNDGDDYYLHH